MKRKFILSATIMLSMIWGIVLYSPALAQEPGSPEYQQMKETGAIPLPNQLPASLGPITTLPEDMSGSRSNYFFELDGTYSSFAGNDDGSLFLSLPFTFCFYGTNYTSLYLNNNGNVSFGTPYGTYSPVGFPSSSYVMIAPFWGDVDTRAGNLTRYKIESNRLIITWDEVCYFSVQCGLVNSFQLVLTDGTDPSIGIGNNVGFAYNDMQWTTGGASGGIGGFGGSPATVGINKGDGTTYALVGRFDHPGSDYDGPGGVVDGVDFLDGKRFTFSTCNFSNIPPVPFGFPNGPVVLNVGDNWTLPVSFIGPEVGQFVTTVVSAPTLPGLNTVINDGNPSAISLSLTPTNADQGIHFIQLTATDNGVPVGITNQYIELHIGNLDPEPIPLSNWPIIMAFIAMGLITTFIIFRRTR